MRDITRGFTSALAEYAVADHRIGEVGHGIEAFQTALAESDPLRFALTDGSVPLAARRGVVNDLLAGRAPEAARLVSYLLGSEAPAELAVAIGQAGHLVRDVGESAATGGAAASDTAGGRGSVWDRVHGYAEYAFSRLADIAEVDTIEDELFRFARVVEESHELSSVLTDRDIPLGVRAGVVEDLLRGKASTTAIRLIAYLLRAGRVRDFVRALDHLVELAAAERGRRFAEVRAPAPLDEADRLRLAAALALMAGRPVEVRVVIDEDVIGGMLVSIGDTLIDGTIRHRLEQLRESLGTSGWSAA